MICDEYRKRELGDLDEERFRAHAQQCPICRRLLRQDAELMRLARSLRQPVDTPFLWSRIEAGLRAEIERDQRRWFRSFIRSGAAFYRIAAILLVAAGLGSYTYFRSDSEPPRLFSKSALERVEKREQEYILAIEDLEREASVQLSRMDLDLMRLYRDKIETIDAQIARCREALRKNPANVHIRRYLLLALQDKRKTLQEIVDRRMDL